MKNKISLLLTIPLAIFAWSCTKDFVVKNISNDVVTILAPANNINTPDNAITFWWEELDGAEKYNLQIVKPSFSATQKLIVDTNVSGTKFKYTLQPGTYQWRIKGVNNGGSSKYVVYNLTIDTTSNLSSQAVIPIAPVDNYLTGNKTITFSWNSLASATNYQIQVFNSSNTVIKDTTTVYNHFTSTFLSGGTYSWKVRAFNSFSISQYNTPLTFTIDITPPGVSVLTAPVNGSFIKDTVELKWTRSSADTRYDSIYVSIDSSFTSIISSNKTYNTKVKINALSPTLPISTSYYWWKVKAIDSVGNKAGFSNQLKFKLY
jgi:predicted secreted protein